MSVSTFNPQNHIHDDGIHMMPTSEDLKRPHHEKQLIDEAMAELNRPKNLIASSRRELPSISVNGMKIDPKAIAGEMQYHKANSQEEALFLSAQALVIRELLRQAVVSHPKLGQNIWQKDEERAIAKLLELEVCPQKPNRETCQQYFKNNHTDFVSTPMVDVRHILLACPPEAGEKRIDLKKQADELIAKLRRSINFDADFVYFAQLYSACPSKDDGGELGVIQKGTTVPEFEQAVFQAHQGLMVNPLASRYGIHIIDIKRRIDGRILNFDEAYPMIANRLEQQSFHHHLCDYLFELTKKADIVGIELNMNQDNIYRG